MRDPDGDIVGWQIRTDSGKPKYLTYTTGKVATRIYGTEGKTLYLVEDLLSALVVSRGLKARAMPLFGTHLTTEHLSRILILKAQEKINRVIVWLDNDNPQVVRKAVQISSSLSSYLPTSRVAYKLQPKELRIGHYS